MEDNSSRDNQNLIRFRFLDGFALSNFEDLIVSIENFVFWSAGSDISDSVDI